jgi:hypothetical protein
VKRISREIYTDHDLVAPSVDVYPKVWVFAVYARPAASLVSKLIDDGIFDTNSPEHGVVKPMWAPYKVNTDG